MGRGKLATPGVRVRTAQSIEIDFYYRGVRCRERLKLAPNTANRRYASRLKAEIESRIARAEFNYAEFFPDSPRARTLSRRSGDVITVREVLRGYVDTAECSLQRSTWLDAINLPVGRRACIEDIFVIDSQSENVEFRQICDLDALAGGIHLKNFPVVAGAEVNISF